MTIGATVVLVLSQAPTTTVPNRNRTAQQIGRRMTALFDVDHIVCGCQVVKEEPGTTKTEVLLMLY